MIHRDYDFSIKYDVYVHQVDGQITDPDLDGLDIEMFKVIEAVMYIGRNYPFTAEECRELKVDRDIFKNDYAKWS